jgi:DNA-binding PadR family transcriptional regulator
MEAFFDVSGPSVHQMLGRLEERGLISRRRGMSRSIRVLVSRDELPELEDWRGALAKHGAPQGPIYQVKVTLQGIDPPVWRRFQVTGDTTLAQLHDILQAVMSWWDYHLHEFTIAGANYGVPHPDDWKEVKDERRVRLRDIADPGTWFVYEYDFGDGWAHLLEVEKILDPQQGQYYPVCIAGERATPPEDVGGVYGYELYLEAMQDPDHPEHEDYLRWRGEFDPEVFDIKAVNRALRQPR